MRASHALRGCGWGGVHFETNPPAGLRMTTTGRATVLNASRSAPADVDTALRELGPGVAFDWRNPPPELSEEEWAVLYGRTDDLTPQKVKRRLASAAEKFGVGTDDQLRAAFAP